MDIIIDCGGWKGDSIIPLRKQYGNHLVHVFECNPALWSFYDAFDNIVLHKEAVWVKDGNISFYLQDNPLWDGHSVCKEKINGSSIDVKHEIVIPCIDFSLWILNNFTKEDNLYLKMNIEGAEYQVLRKMFKDGSIDYLKKAHISFHQERYPNIVTEEEHKQVIELYNNWMHNK